MPPTEDVQAAVKQILQPFDENGNDEDGSPNSHAFWDYWVIGGRWAGDKIRQSYDQAKMDAFAADLQEHKITVSGLRFGKEEISPASQIPLVDQLWNKHFPDSPTKVCPLFKHYNDQYRNTPGFSDVMALKDLPSGMTACHVIIAGPSWKDDGTVEATYMMQESIWNGVTHITAQWDGKVSSVIDAHKQRLQHAKPEYAAKHIPQDDWLVVTVDYHSYAGKAESGPSAPKAGRTNQQWSRP